MDDIPAFLYELGLVLRQSPGTPGAASLGPPAMMAATAARLAAFAVSMQWLHVTRLLLPLTLATGRAPAEAVSDMDASLPPGELPYCRVLDT